MSGQATKTDLNGLEARLDKRFEKIDKQFDRIVKVVVKGFDRIDKTLETKANNDDMQKALGLTQWLSVKKFLMTKDL